MSEKVKWVTDPAHSEIGFKVRHLMISNVKGVFKKFEATIMADGNDFRTAEINVLIDPSSVDTGNAQRDKDLKSDMFFDAENYRQLTFMSDRFEQVGTENKYALWGKLTIKNVTVVIKLDVEFGGIMKDPDGIEKAGFSVTGCINRKEWGLNWNTALETGGVMVGEDVKIEAEMEFKRAEEVSTVKAAAEEQKVPEQV